MTSNSASPDQRFQLLHEYIKTLLGLSSGALVFSVTVVLALLERDSSLSARPLLYGAWGFWLLGLGGSLMHLLYLIKAAKERAGSYAAQLRLGASLSLSGFLLGLLAFVAFGAWNL